jgi:hypothetical protein
LAGVQNVAQIVDGGLSEFADQFDNAIAFHALLGAEETVGEMFDGISGKLLQNVDQIVGNLIGVDGFLDHLRQAVFDADAGAEILHQPGRSADAFEREQSSATALYFLRVQASCPKRAKAALSRL